MDRRNLSEFVRTAAGGVCPGENAVKTTGRMILFPVTAFRQIKLLAAVFLIYGLIYYKIAIFVIDLLQKYYKFRRNRNNSAQTVDISAKDC